MRLIIAAMALTLASTGTVEGGELATEVAGATTIVDAFHAALDSGDTAGAARLLSDDALIFEEGHAERSKAEYAQHHLPADAAFSRAVSSTVTRRSGGGEGGDIAWISSEGRATGTYKGKSVDSMTTETMVLRRVGGSWKIVHIHWSSHSMKGG